MSREVSVQDKRPLNRPLMGGQQHGFRSAREILGNLPGDLVVSKQRVRRAEAIACVRLKRQEAHQKSRLRIATVRALRIAD